jgi:hypothetical protein
MIVTLVATDTFGRPKGDVSDGSVTQRNHTQRELGMLKRILLAAILAVTAATASARADILIDDFSLPSPRQQYAIAPDPNPLVISTNLGGGLTRDITLTVNGTAGTNALTGQVGGGAAAGFFTASFDVASSGTARIVYTYASSQNFVPTGTAGALRFLAAGDPGFAPNIPLNIVITTATGNLNFDGQLPLTGTLTPVEIPLSSFTGPGDLTQVTGLNILMTGGQAADFVFDVLDVSTPQGPSVPAPPAAFLALAALPAVGLWRVVRRKAA